MNDGVAAGHVYNSSPIDGTDTLRSVLTIGRELRFLLDIALSALPLLVYDNAESVIFDSVSPILIVSLPLKF